MSEETEVQRSLGRIEGKLDGVLQSQQRAHEEREVMRKDIDQLKKQDHRYAGAFGVLFLLLTFKDTLAQIMGFRG